MIIESAKVASQTAFDIAHNLNPVSVHCERRAINLAGERQMNTTHLLKREMAIAALVVWIVNITNAT
ncbi:hypothetical protein B7486_21215 [cyanobacterium TDX16]|nr:hypothetical protein B7486_21215 [cyanobacterium TDX16]